MGFGFPRIKIPKIGDIIPSVPSVDDIVPDVGDIIPGGGNDRGGRGSRREGLDFEEIKQGLEAAGIDISSRKLDDKTKAFLQNLEIVTERDDLINDQGRLIGTGRNVMKAIQENASKLLPNGVSLEALDDNKLVKNPNPKEKEKEQVSAWTLFVENVNQKANPQVAEPAQGKEQEKENRQSSVDFRALLQGSNIEKQSYPIQETAAVSAPQIAASMPTITTGRGFMGV
jgi:hypothetical protein